MIKNVLLIGVIVSHCYAMEETKESEADSIPSLVARFSKQSLNNNQPEKITDDEIKIASSAAAFKPDSMVTDGIYGAGL